MMLRIKAASVLLGLAISSSGCWAQQADYSAMSVDALLSHAESKKSVDAAIELVQKRMTEVAASGKYEGGRTSDPYVARAMNVLIERAQAGVPQAMYFVGLALKSGYGIDENQSMGDNLIRGAAQRGDSNAKELEVTLGSNRAIPITYEKPSAVAPSSAQGQVPTAKHPVPKNSVRRY